jgi:hypothetical protein
MGAMDFLQVSDAQLQWQICVQCGCLFFAGERPNLGRCVGGVVGGGHTGNPNSTDLNVVWFASFFQKFGDPRCQLNWKHCRKCKCLFFDGDPFKGMCHDLGDHDSSGSGVYGLWHFRDNTVPRSPFRYCRKCQCLFHPALPGVLRGVCIASFGAIPGGLAHDGSGSGQYEVSHLIV